SSCIQRRCTGIAVASFVAALISSIASSFFLQPPPPTAIYTLSLHDALPIYKLAAARLETLMALLDRFRTHPGHKNPDPAMPLERSEEHTSELQSQSNLVCRLLLEKKKTHDRHS